MKLYNQTRSIDLGPIRKAGTFFPRLAGLLFSNPANENVLWITPCRSLHTVGMRWPIDVAFLSKEMKVMKTFFNVMPFKIGPACSGAHSVLESFAGKWNSGQVQMGDQLRIEA